MSSTSHIEPAIGIPKALRRGLPHARSAIARWFGRWTWTIVAGGVIAPPALGLPPDPAHWPAWLMSPAEREVLARTRSRSASDASDRQEAVARGPWRLDGWAAPQQRDGSAWVNGQLVQSGERLAEGVVVGQIGSGHLILRLDGRAYRLRPGQILHLDGSVTDTLPPFVTHPQRAVTHSSHRPLPERQAARP